MIFKRLRRAARSAAVVLVALVACQSAIRADPQPSPAPAPTDQHTSKSRGESDPGESPETKSRPHVGPVPEVIRVLVDDALVARPFVVRDADGNWSGFNIELLRDCAHAVGSRVELVTLRPGRTVQQAIDAGEADVLPLAFEGDPQLVRINPGRPLLHVAPGIWVRRNSAVSTQLTSLARVTSTAVAGGPTARWLERQGIQVSKFARNRREALRLVAAGYVKVLFAGHAVMVGEVEDLNLGNQLDFIALSGSERIGSVSFGYGTKGENAAFWLAAGLDVVGASGRYADHYRRFVAPRAELGDQAIASEAVYYSSVVGGGHLPGQTLRLGVAGRGAGLNFIYDKETKTGLAIDLGLALGRTLRRPVEFVDLTDEDPSDAVARGAVHAVALVPTTSADPQSVDLLQPILTLRGAVIMRRGEPAPTSIEELRKLKVAVAWNSGSHWYATSIAHPGIVPVDGSSQAMDLLTNRKVDAVIMLAAAMRNLDRRGLLPSALEEHPLPDRGFFSKEAITVRRGNTLLARDIESSLSALQRSGEFDRIYDRWLGSIEPRQTEVDWTAIYAALAGVLLAVTIAVAWIVTLRRTLAIRTERVRLAEGQTAMLASALPVLMFTYVVRTDGTRSPVYFPSNADNWRRRFPCMSDLDRPYEHALRAAIHPEDVDAYDAAATRARSTLSTFDFEYRLRTSDGRYRWLHSIAVPRRVPEGVCWDSLVVDIDDQRTMLQSVQNSKARFSVLVQHAPHAAIQFYDLAGRVTAWNAASARLYGWTAEEAIGKSAASLMLTETEAETFRAEIARLAAGGAPGTPVEMPFRTKSGGSGTLVSSVFAIPNEDGSAPDEFVCMDIDITELRHAQERERLARDHLAMAMDASKIGSWSVTLKDEMVTADARIIELFGMAGRMTPGVPAHNKDLLINIAPEDIATVAKAWNMAVDTVGLYACTFRLRVDGKETWISGRGMAYPGPDGKSERIVGISVDITELKRAQIEREQLIVALERSKRLEALGLLAAGVAHDFNNILTAISGYAAMIEHNIDDRQSTVDHLHAIESSTNQAALLIRQLIARPARDRTSLSGTDILDVVRGCVAVATAGPGGAATCSIRSHPDAERLLVDADRAQVQQIVLNLIINAAEAARPGPNSKAPATVDVKLHRREIAAGGLRIATLAEPLPQGTYLAIDVADNGPGMDDTTQQKIFEPFFSTKVSGRGLGLSVVVSTIHALGGAIKVSSAIGQGTTFRVLLPATVPNASPVTHDLTRMIAQVEAKPSQRGHVLVVDDDALVHDVIVRALSAVGHRVTSFHNGRDAINWLSSPDLLPTDQPTIAVIDLTMPGIDGIETLRQLRAILPGLNAVMTSGYASESVSLELAELGRAQFLQKPFKLKELQEVVRNSASAASPS